jgi:hypothetical protein
MNATCPSHLLLIDFITLTKVDEAAKNIIINELNQKGRTLYQHAKYYKERSQ